MKLLFLQALCLLQLASASFLRHGKWQLRKSLLQGKGEQVHRSKVYYGLVVDAGSSGSRIRMFKWTLGPKVDMSEIVPSEDDEDNFEVQPGLSSYAEKPSDSLTDLASLIEAAKGYIPKPDWEETRLFLKATAGMRLLLTSKAQKVMDTVRKFLSDPGNCPFKFVSAEIISGEEEAVYSYLTANYNLGTLESPNKTVGALEMGGASMQVIFRPTIDIQDHEFQFYLGNKLRSVYAKSYIRFGINDAISRSMRLLAQSSPNQTEVPSPCHNPGFKHKLKLPSGEHQVFVGTGNVTACTQVVRKMMGLDVECLMPPCAIFGSYMTPISGQFYAFAAFFFTANGLGLVDWKDSKALAPDDIAEATKTYCGKDLKTAQSDSGAPMKFAEKYCFMGVYVQQSLLAFGFSPDVASVIFSRKLRGFNLGWPAGSILYETQLMPLSLDAKAGGGIRSLCSQPAPPAERGKALGHALHLGILMISLALGLS